jgi:hypothetical protein
MPGRAPPRARRAAGFHAVSSPSFASRCVRLRRRPYPGSLSKKAFSIRSRTIRPVRVRTAAPTKKQTTSTTTSEKKPSAGIHSGSSAAIGRSRPAHRLHAFDQQQERQVDRNHDEQASNDRARDKFARVFHASAFRGIPNALRWETSEAEPSAAQGRECLGPQHKKASRARPGTSAARRREQTR